MLYCYETQAGYMLRHNDKSPRASESRTSVLDVAYLLDMDTYTALRAEQYDVGSTRSQVDPSGSGANGKNSSKEINVKKQERAVTV
jgi:hypothetical protein